MKKKVNKKAILTAIAITVGASTASSASSNIDSLFGLNELNSSTLIACKNSKCGSCSGLLKEAGINKKMRKRGSSQIKESKCGSGKCGSSKCGEALCATKKTKNFLKHAGAGKKM